MVIFILKQLLYENRKATDKIVADFVADVIPYRLDLITRSCRIHLIIKRIW